MQHALARRAVQLRACWQQAAAASSQCCDCITRCAGYVDFTCSAYCIGVEMTVTVLLNVVFWCLALCAALLAVLQDLDGCSACRNLVSIQELCVSIGTAVESSASCLVSATRRLQMVYAERAVC
jgi:hypothetical protein